MKALIFVIVAGLCVGGCATVGCGKRSERVSVFYYEVDAVVKERNVSYEQAGEMLRKAGVTGFDAAYDCKDIDRYLRAGLAPANFYGKVEFLAPDGGAAKADAFISSAVRYGAKTIMIIPDNFSGMEDQETEFSKMLPGLRAMVAKALAAGLTPTMEDVGAGVKNPCSYRKYLVRFIREVPGLMLVLDSGNLSYANRGDDILGLMHDCRGRIAHVHLKDFAEPGPTKRRTTLGYGIIPNREIIEFVKGDSYAGWYTIEHAVGPDVYDDIVRQAALINIWGM